MQACRIPVYDSTKTNFPCIVCGGLDAEKASEAFSSDLTERLLNRRTQKLGNNSGAALSFPAWFCEILLFLCSLA